MDGQDFRINAGNNLEVFFNVSNVSDLSGYEILWKARTRTGEEIVKEGNIKDENTFSIHLKEEDTNDLGGERLNHEAILINEEGKKITIAKGGIKINESLFAKETL